MNSEDLQFKMVPQSRKIKIPEEMIVEDWAFYLAEYDAAYHSMISDTESLPEPSRSDMRRIRINEIKDDFVTKRTAEFESKKHFKSVSHSCTKGYRGGGTKDCGWKYVNSPHPEIYTRNDLLKVVSGKAKKVRALNNGSSAGIYQSKSGKGRIAGTLTATFVYRPQYIKKNVSKDLGDLWRAIISSSN